jgi:hypothetical protein
MENFFPMINTSATQVLLSPHSETRKKQEIRHLKIKLNYRCAMTYTEGEHANFLSFKTRKKNEKNLNNIPNRNNKFLYGPYKRIGQSIRPGREEKSTGQTCSANWSNP